MSAGNVDGLPQQAATTTASLAQRRKWLLVATFLVAYLLAMVMVAYVHETHAESRRLAVRMLAQGYAQRIQENLQTALISTYMLASVVKQSGGQVENFDGVAAELITLFPSVSAVQLAPNGIIQDIYPLQGNEAAVGHNLLADPKRNREAVEAVTRRQLTLAGPFSLVQGGVGAVGRMPVFLPNERNELHFWGFTTALIRIPVLLDAAGMNSLAKAGYRFELWRVNPDTEQRQVFARSGKLAPVAPVEYVITVYGGRWVLSLAPEEGWTTAADYAEIFLYSLAVALLITLLQYFGLRALLRPPA